MAGANLIFHILLFLAVMEATLSLKEWKKYENGMVQSQKHKVVRLTKNKTEGDGTKEQTHILHAHNGEKVNHHKDKNEQAQKVQQKENADQSQGNQPQRVFKDRHHRKNMEKMLHSGHRGKGDKQSNDTPAPIPHSNGKKDGGAEDDLKKKDSSKARTKPEGMSSIQWRRMQNREEKVKMERAKRIAEEWLNRTDFAQTRKKKKYTVNKMDGNKNARKIWKDVFRGANRLVLK